MSRKANDEEAFWSNVEIPDDADGCWNWIGESWLPNGYGKAKSMYSNSTTTAHKVAWEYVNGPVPKGLCICHDCPNGDNRACCNPDHLWMGTYKENTQDGMRKGRINNEEHRRKTSEMLKGNKYTLGRKLSVEQIDKLRKVWLGRHHTEETKRKISESSKNIPKSVRMQTGAKHRGKFVSDETRAKIRAARLGTHASEETKRKLSEARKGRPGHIPSEETKKKISESLKGRKCGSPSEETRKKMSAAMIGNTRNLGHVASKETREKLSKALKGRPSPLRGRSQSEETKRKKSEALKGRHIPDEARKNMSIAQRRRFTRDNGIRYPRILTVPRTPLVRDDDES